MKKKIIRGTGSVYRDLGFENPEEWEAKADLAGVITKISRDRQWTQKQVEEHLGIKRAEVSNIYRGQFDRFTLGRLMAYVRQLESDVEIVVRPRQDHLKGELAVVSA